MISVFDLLSLSQVPGIGSNRLRALVSHFKDTTSILRATIHEISSVDGFDKKLSSMIFHFIRGKQFEIARQFADRQLSKINKMELKIITCWDQKSS